MKNKGAMVTLSSNILSNALSTDRFGERNSVPYSRIRAGERAGGKFKDVLISRVPKEETPWREGCVERHHFQVITQNEAINGEPHAEGVDAPPRFKEKRRGSFTF